MLTAQKFEKIDELIAGRRQPNDGMERLFLRVINGDALAYSTKE